jgi:hypothetical protein
MMAPESYSIELTISSPVSHYVINPEKNYKDNVTKKVKVIAHIS